MHGLRGIGGNLPSSTTGIGMAAIKIVKTHILSYYKFPILTDHLADLSNDSNLAY